VVTTVREIKKGGGLAIKIKNARDGGKREISVAKARETELIGRGQNQETHSKSKKKPAGTTGKWRKDL